MEYLQCIQICSNHEISIVTHMAEKPNNYIIILT